MSCLHIQGVRREVTGCAPFLFLGRKTDAARIAGIRANARHPNPQIRATAAASPVAPASLLNQLVYDEAPEVREWVARNIKSPVQALRELATDKEARVRAYVAWNPSSPSEVIKLLCDDTEMVVRELAAQRLVAEE